MPASAADAQLPAHTLGGVELREDVPLKSRAGAGAGGPRGAGRCCAGAGGGPRLIPAAFAALSACITLALLTQIYCGDYELVPHGSVSSSAAACSRAGTDALKAGGRAMDAAVAAALCLAVVAPHRTSLDASGSMLYWEYRESRTQLPALYEWGGPGAGGGDRAPRLVSALAYLHSQLGALPWPRLLAPAIQLARDGFPVSEGLAAVSAARGAVRPAGTNATAPELARYLGTLLVNTSAELSAAWGGATLVRGSAPARARAGQWRVLAGGAVAGAVLRALGAALQPPPRDADDAQRRVVSAMQREPAPAAAHAGATASGLAVVDSRDTYVALVTGLSEPFGSGEVTAAGWRRDEPTTSLDLAPAMLLDPNVCGARYVLGAESAAALVQAAAALATARAGAGAGEGGAVERARVAWGGGAELRNTSLPLAAVNLVLQRGDALSSHADSRGGGIAYRF